MFSLLIPCRCNLQKLLMSMFFPKRNCMFFLLNSFKKAFRVRVTYLNIHTWKKNIKTFFVCKYDAQMNCFAVVKKLYVNERIFFFEKQIPYFQNSVQIFNLWLFHSSKNLFFTTKLVIKFEQQKIKKNPPIISENIITQTISQNFFKIGLNPNVLWRFSTRVEVSVR